MFPIKHIIMCDSIVEKVPYPLCQLLYGLPSLQEMLFASYKYVGYGQVSTYRHIGDLRLDEAKKYEQMVPVTDHSVLDVPAQLKYVMVKG